MQRWSHESPPEPAWADAASGRSAPVAGTMSPEPKIAPVAIFLSLDGFVVLP